MQYAIYCAAIMLTFSVTNYALMRDYTTFTAACAPSPQYDQYEHFWALDRISVLIEEDVATYKMACEALEKGFLLSSSNAQLRSKTYAILARLVELMPNEEVLCLVRRYANMLVHEDDYAAFESGLILIKKLIPTGITLPYDILRAYASFDNVRIKYAVLACIKHTVSRGWNPLFARVILAYLNDSDEGIICEALNLYAVALNASENACCRGFVVRLVIGPLNKHSSPLIQAKLLDLCAIVVRQAPYYTAIAVRLVQRAAASDSEEVLSAAARLLGVIIDVSVDDASVFTILCSALTRMQGSRVSSVELSFELETLVKRLSSAFPHYSHLL